jgi:hypothetical protein
MTTDYDYRLLCIERICILADSINNNDDAMSVELACKGYFCTCESFVSRELKYQSEIERLEGIGISEELLFNNHYV